MKLFKQKESLIENIAFMGLMSAINIVLAVVIALVPFMGFILVLILPLISALTEIYTKDRYYPIYAVATIGLALVATLWNIETTIYYLIPAVITGYIFGLISKKGISPIWAIMAASILEAGLTYVSFLITNAILGIDVIETIKVLLNLKDSKTFDTIIPFALVTFALVEMSLSYFVIHFELKKLNVEQSDNDDLFMMDIATIVYSLLIIPMYFMAVNIGYVTLAFAIFLTIYIITMTISKKDIRSLVFYGISLIAGVIFFILMNPIMKETSGLLSLGIIPFLISLINLLHCFLNKNIKK